MESRQVKKVAIIAGTRPEVIKLAPVVTALNQLTLPLKTCLIHTGQHRELADEAWSLFGLLPDYHLQVMTDNQALDALTGRILQALSPVLQSEKPDLVLVQGDTVSALAGAMSAFFHGIPVGHVEAGLRSGDKFQPYPEETNRVLISRLTDLHFAPTASARQNLLNESIPDHNIWVVGNPVVDSLQLISSNGVLPFQKTSPHFIIATVHRRENQGDRLTRICRALQNVAAIPDVELVIPVHPNPRVRTVVETILGDMPSVRLLPPMAYPAFIGLLQACSLIITDSGGIQEEATVLGKPVVLLRELTERPEAVASQVVKMVSLNEDAILTEVKQLLENPSYYAQRSRPTPVFGDGKSGMVIAQLVARYLSG